MLRSLKLAQLAARTSRLASSGVHSSAAQGRPTDKVLLRGLLFHAHHGVLPAEQDLGQKFRVDLTLDVDTRDAGSTDDLSATVDYAAVYECACFRSRAGLLSLSPTSCLSVRCVRHIVQGPPRQLVESVAHEVARNVLGNFPLAHSVTVRVTKPHVAVSGVLESLGASQETTGRTAV